MNICVGIDFPLMCTKIVYTPNVKTLHNSIIKRSFRGNNKRLFRWWMADEAKKLPNRKTFIFQRWLFILSPNTNSFPVFLLPSWRRRSVSDNWLRACKKSGEIVTTYPHDNALDGNVWFNATQCNMNKTEIPSVTI